MERKIGEIFEYDGEWYQCVFAIDGCRECSFRAQDYCTRHSECFSDVRSDGISVIFKKLEKVGEPYCFQKRIFQTYKIFTIPFLSENTELVAIPSKDNTTIEIEIKQTKEDMEGNKVKISKGNADYLISKLQAILADHLHGGESDEVIAEFENLLEIDNPKEKKLNLKPFDLEKAKAGKPVCTRDGRKARIICWDRIDSTGCNLPIVALVQCEETEVLQLYHDDGKCDVKADLDLMMLPEKKEGWVNVYKNQIHDTPESAEEGHKGITDYIKTIRVEWEE